MMTPTPSRTGSDRGQAKARYGDGMDILAHILEWQRLDDAAFLAEHGLELTLDAYCNGDGPPPTPAEQAVATKLRLLASARVLSIQRTLRRVLADENLI